MFPSSTESTMAEPAWRSFALGALPQNLCEVLAWKRLTLPEAVRENRFFEPEWVFNFGMIAYFF